MRFGINTFLDNGYASPDFRWRYHRWFRWSRVPIPKRSAIHPTVSIRKVVVGGQQLHGVEVSGDGLERSEPMSGGTPEGVQGVSNGERVGSFLGREGDTLVSRSEFPNLGLGFFLASEYVENERTMRLPAAR